MSAVIGRILIALIVLATTFHYLVSPDDKGRLKNLLYNWGRGVFTVARPLLSAWEASLQPIVQAFVGAIQNFGGPIFTDISTPVKSYAEDAYNLSAAGLVSQGASTPANAIKTAAQAFADAAGFGIGSAGMAAAFAALFPKELNVLDNIAPMLATLAGFEEISGAVRAPLYANAFGKSLDYHFRSIFKAEYPDESDAVQWHSRGLLTDDQLRVIFNYSGLKSEYEQPFIASAYRAISPFILTRAMEFGAVSADKVREVMTFGGLRPQDQETMIDAYNLLALQPYQKQALSAAIVAAERGTISSADLSDAMNNLAVPTDAQPIVQLEVHYKRLEQLMTLFLRSVSEAYQYGEISDADYVAHLEAAGVEAPDAEAHYAIDAMRVKGKALARAAREAASQQKRVTAAAARAATAAVLTQQIDTLAYEAALTAAGVNGGVIPFMVSLAATRLAAQKRSVFGRLVSKGEAILLRETIAAIGEQVRKKLLTPELAYQRVLAQSIPPINAQALVADWAAVAKVPWVPPQLPGP